MSARLWVRLVSWLVPRDERPDWTEEWLAELAAQWERSGLCAS